MAKPKYTKPEVIKFSFQNRNKLNDPKAPAIELVFNPVKLDRGENVVPKVEISTMSGLDLLQNCFGDDNFRIFVADKFNDDCRAAWIDADGSFPLYDDKVRSFTSAIKAIFAAEKKERIKTSGDLLIEGGKLKKEIAAETDAAKKSALMEKLVRLKADYAAAKAREEAMLDNLSLD